MDAPGADRSLDAGRMGWQLGAGGRVGSGLMKSIRLTLRRTKS